MTSVLSVPSVVPGSPNYPVHSVRRRRDDVRTGTSHINRRPFEGGDTLSTGRWGHHHYTLRALRALRGEKCLLSQPDAPAGYTPAMPTLVLLRHGQSTWNRENRFTGWVDVDLSETGRKKTTHTGRLLAEEGLDFDLTHTSVLKRAIRTLAIVLDEMDRMWLPEARAWRLNERHYGSLQGLDKAQTAAKHGEEQVLQWRRSFATPPPPMEPSDPDHPSHDRRYAHVPPDQLPRGESLKDTIARVLPYWNETIAPQLRAGHRVLVVAHGNSLRALVRHLDNLSDEAIMATNIPTGVPLLYDLADDLTPRSSRYLGDAAQVEAAMAAVAAQGKARS